jgi:hypothetical protein
MVCTVGLCVLIAGWLNGHNYEPFQRDAILKSLWVESRFEQCVSGPSGMYLAQWAGPRLAYIHRHYPGCPPWEWQLERLDYELRNEPAYGCFWKAHDYPTAYSAFRRGFEHGKC